MLARRFMVTLALSLIMLAPASPAAAEDAFYDVSLAELKITSGTLPTRDMNVYPFSSYERFRRLAAFGAAVVLDGPGEGYFATENWRTAFEWMEAGDTPVQVTFRTPKGKEISGQFLVPNKDTTAAEVVRFSVPASAASDSAREKFFAAKVSYYRALQSRDVPGAAWFRHQAATAQPELSKERQEQLRNRWNWQVDRADTFELFSGGRAVSENLQLDRQLRPVSEDESQQESVALDSLQGITVAEIDWKPYLKDANPTLDPLAKLIPADQHVVFFPSFHAMVKCKDELGDHGANLLRMAEVRSEDDQTVQRYERQLGLSLSGLGRLLGPAVVKSVAITGSDPYFRTGTDVGVIFETDQPEVLVQLLLAQVKLKTANERDVLPYLGQRIHGFHTHDRRIDSNVVQLPGAVMVTNSLSLQERMAPVASGSKPSIASLDEYKFFRTRYKLGEADEAAFVFLSDPTIRRWCSPRWRIATGRRAAIAAAIAEVAARNVSALAAADASTQVAKADGASLDAMDFMLTAHGVRSKRFGTLAWMKPIVELPVDKVTPAEAESYKQWRDQYQRYWQGMFDPIGLRVSLRDDRWSADVTVMPLIAQSDYQTFIALSRGADIKPGAGDRHDALVHVAMAINKDSTPFKMSAGFLAGMVPGLNNPLDWLGSSVSVYVDDDPFWKQLGEMSPEQRREVESQLPGRMPVALYAEVSDPLKLAAFLAAARAFIEQTAPGMTEWESRKHNEQPYLRVGPTPQTRQEMPSSRETNVYYSPSPTGLVVTFNEDVMKRALDRRIARGAGKADGAAVAKNVGEGKPDRSWLGSNFCLQVDHKMFGILGGSLLSVMEGSDDELQATMQFRCWDNLWILNEWKRLLPEQDPVALHERLFGARLVCPGGGKYVWNAEWRTMESSIYGHPGAPKKGPTLTAMLDQFTATNFGLTFEEHGLRARMELHRAGKK